LSRCSQTTGLQFNGHESGDGELILKHAGKLGFEGVVSKTFDAPYAPGNRGLLLERSPSFAIVVVRQAPLRL
jgi:ATP-dependent DNA ligase